jgi:UDP-N-acetylmuramoyl-L-alanyl-D-glutamate--2,6-diaminopimelate ligase
VPEMKLATLTQSIAEVPAPLHDLMPTGLSLDSRSTENGSVFVALPGFESDGRDYIDAAF